MRFMARGMGVKLLIKHKAKPSARVLPLLVPWLLC